MKQLEGEDKAVPGSDKWSIVLKESAGLKLFDGIYSTSQLLTEHSAVDSSQPGNKAAFYLSSGMHHWNWLEPWISENQIMH